MKGYIHVYTGDGKGKTTAALGLAIRAIGAGLKVYILQFAKGMEYSEIRVLKDYPDNVTVKQCGQRCFIYEKPDESDITLAREGFREGKAALLSGDYDVVIFDEANIAMWYNLVSEEEFLALMDEKPEHVEFILTGRKATDNILNKADLVTEMKEIKHYYQKGVEARKGIES